MDWTRFFCCGKQNTTRPTSRRMTLQNLVTRRYTEQNIYTVLKSPPPSECRNTINNDEPFHNVRYFRANCDITGVLCTELSLRVGDIIEVDEAYENRYIHRARHVRNGLVGFVSKAHLDNVPIVELQPWYFHNITRPLARSLLLNSPQTGTFLVRKSETKGQAYSLSIRANDSYGRPSVLHYKIQTNIHGYYISEGCHDKYLDGLLKLYQDDVHGYLRLNPRLKQPCHRDTRYIIDLDEFDTSL